MAYAKLCDAGYPPTQLAAMFTEDAIWDGGERFGVHYGRQGIYDFFDAISRDLVFAFHFMIRDSIEVADDGQSATGSWQLLEPCTLAG